MMTFLATAPELIEKVRHIAQVDPHGWTITLISVLVVFAALLLLYGAYTVVGWICSGKAMKEYNKRMRFHRDSETAAVIAAAIELALKDENKHDRESYVITIRRA